MASSVTSCFICLLFVWRMFSWRCTSDMFSRTAYSILPSTKLYYIRNVDINSSNSEFANLVTPSSLHRRDTTLSIYLIFNCLTSFFLWCISLNISHSSDNGLKNKPLYFESNRALKQIDQRCGVSISGNIQNLPACFMKPTAGNLL